MSTGTRWLTVAETAELLHLSARTVYELIREGQIRTVKVGRSRRVPISELDAFNDRLLKEAGT